MAMVISSYVDDSPGLANNGQPMRLLDVAILPESFHPDLYIDSDPPLDLPGPRECLELRLAQPPFWLDRNIYGTAHGHGFEDWHQKFGEFVQVMYETRPNTRPYLHKATPLPAPPVHWNIPIYARWDWSPVAYIASFKLEPDSFLSRGLLAELLLRERLQQAVRDLQSIVTKMLIRSENPVSVPGSADKGGATHALMSDWLTAYWADPIESGGCTVEIREGNIVTISDRWTQRTFRILFSPSHEFIRAVNRHREFGRISVGLRFNVLASREVVVTEMVLLDERNDVVFSGCPPLTWIGSNDLGRPLPFDARYLSI